MSTEAETITETIDETTTASNGYTYKTDPQSKQRYVEIEENFRVVEELITREGSPFKGMTYHTQQFTSVGKLLEKLGEEKTLSLCNDRLSALGYIKAINGVKSRLSENKEKWATELAALYPQDKVIFSIEDAKNFVPGERDETVKQLGKQLAEAHKNMNKLLQEGKIAEAKVEMGVVTELMEKINRLAEMRMRQLEAAEASAELE